MMAIVVSSFSQVKDSIVKVVEVMPQYPGGDDALLDDIYSNFKYPKIARENRVEGKVIVQYVVDTFGMIINVEILSSLSPELDAEALRLVRELKQYTPGTQNEKKAKVTYTLPLEFSIDEGELLNMETVDIDALTTLGWAFDLQFLMGNYQQDLQDLINRPLGWNAGISFYNKKKVLDFRVNYLISRVKKGFSYRNTIWTEDRLGSYIALEINGGYKIVNTKRVNVIPILGVGYGGYLPWKPEENAPVNELLGVTVNAGLMLDFKRKYRQFSNNDYNYQMIRLKLSYTPIFLKDDYSGAVFHVGVGYGLFLSRFN